MLKKITAVPAGVGVALFAIASMGTANGAAATEDQVLVGETKSVSITTTGLRANSAYASQGPDVIALYGDIYFYLSTELDGHKVALDQPRERTVDVRNDGSQGGGGVTPWDTTADFADISEAAELCIGTKNGLYGRSADPYYDYTLIAAGKTSDCQPVTQSGESSWRLTGDAGAWVQLEASLNVSFPSVNDYDQALASIQESIDEATLSGRPAVYQSSTDFALPVLDGEGDKSVVGTRSTLLIVPNASGANPSQDRPRPALLGDSHRGNDSRCEDNPNAIVDRLQQSSELYTPATAYEKMNRPDVLINANYFEIREQKNGTTWLGNLCSSPQGMYFDNHPASATDNVPATGNPFFAGTPEYVHAGGEVSVIDTFFFVDDSEDGSRATTDFELVRNSTLNSADSVARAEDLTNAGDYFSAMSGTALLPDRGDEQTGQPDSGSSSTTRIAIGYNAVSDTLLILQGGEYRDGFTRDSLAGVMNALDSSIAIELDGGGSSAFVVDPTQVEFVGASSSPSNLNCNEQACFSPITQPSGKPRPVPGWLAIDFTE